MGIAIERIMSLIQAHGINGAKLQAACNLDSTIVAKWKQGRQKPSADALVKIADYFGVTTDYLLGRTDNPHPSNYIPKNTISFEALSLWEQLTPSEASVVCDLMKGIIRARENG